LKGVYQVMISLWTISHTDTE